MHDYNTILGVIELRLSKVSYDSVQKRYRIGRSGIALIMNRYKDSGLSLDDLRQMPASKVVDLIYPKENLRHKDIPLPDFEKIHEQMIQMGKHADLSFLWIDYKKEHPNGYQLAQFYKLYRDFMVDTYGTSKTSMPVERVPGEKMYIDWVGDQPELLLDTTTGELRKVHIFTTTLGFSSLVYAEIFPDEKLPHFITGTVHALSYYGAVPKYLVPDNLRTAVTRHSKDELVLQSAFSDLETFYDTIILPPPPRKPKGKPTVENHVRFLETHLVEELKKDTYTSLEALNAAVKKIVADINQRALCDMIMLPRRKGDCRHPSVFKAVHHNAIRHQKVNRAFGVLRLKRAPVKNMSLRKRRVADSRAVAGNQHAGQIQPLHKIACILDHAPRADADANPRCIRPANGVYISLRNGLMVAEQQRSIHIKCDHLIWFHLYNLPLWYHSVPSVPEKGTPE